MARIKINCDSVDSANLILNSIKNSIITISNESYSLYLPPIFGSQYNINSRVWSSINKLNSINYKLNSIGNVVSSATSKYKMTDNQIRLQKVVKKSHSISSSAVSKNMGFFDDWNITKNTLGNAAKIISGLKFADNKDSQDGKGIIRQTVDGVHFIKDKKNEIVDDIIDKTSVKGEAKASVSLSKGEASVEGKYGSASASYDLLNANAYAAGAAGVFQKDKDGNIVFNPNVNAKVGAGVTVLSVAADAKAGNDLLGASGHVDATVGKASAAGELKAGLMDAEGNFNPSAKVSASLEAIAAEANAKAGVTVLGTDVTAKAGVNVGIGAHADVGYSEGVFKFDVGASLGVGVSVDLEVDVSKTVDAVKDVAIDVADKVIDSTINTAKYVANVTSDAVDAVSNAASSAWNSVTSFFGGL